MAGIYIHIPFCRQACHYCNFHFSTSLRYKNELLTALLKEINLRADLQKSIYPQSPAEPIETIYFGGGTPSLCTKEELKAMLEQFRQSYPVAEGAEITLEANPDDITETKLEEWLALGITRLSIGIQSFFEEDLRWMNRAHDARQASQSLEWATRYFQNISIDLIYGTPGLTNDRWKENVERALAFGIPHLSCYALTVEPQTPLDKMIREHRSADVNPDIQSEQFMLLMDWLADAGYEHYEISNFARPGYRSRHNSSYWQGKHYTGFGPSAHSFDGDSRWWNRANNTQYIRSINEGSIPLEREVLTPIQRINEFIMISLRTMEGIDTAVLQNKDWGLDEKERARIYQQVMNESRKHLDRGVLIRMDDRLILTREGKLLADGIAADLFPDQ